MLSLLAALVLASGFWCASSFDDLFATGQNRRCRYERAHGMMGAYCAGLSLMHVPQSLKTSIEVLDASDNYMKELVNDSFQQYSGLRFLYLNNNKVQIIEPLAFVPLTYLETLDLTFNSLTTIPSEILNLPSLRKLYLSQNFLTSLDADLAKLERPIKAPLTYLNLAECKLKHMPDLGILSQLESLNVSHNQFSALEPVDFAKLCKLGDLDLTDTIISIKYCELKPAFTWFAHTGINARRSVDETLMTSYDASDDNCPKVEFDTKTLKTHSECQNTIVTAAAQRGVRQTWLIVCSSLGGFLIGFILLLFLMHRRNVARTKMITKKNIAKNNKENKCAKENLLENDI